MNASELRKLAISALQKNPETEPDNPEWDSLDKLEIISAVHDTFREKVADIEDLDDFSDFESLYKILKGNNLVE